MDMEQVFEAIRKERQKQDDKWGEQHHFAAKWLTILLEEMGEVAKDLLENAPPEKLRGELIQAAAVITAWLEDESSFQ